MGLLALVLFAVCMSVATAQPIVDFNTRFGKPRIERYKVSDQVRLSVEYRGDGKVSAIEIAPAEYRGYNPTQPLEMSSQAVDRILEKLIPGVTSNGLASETVIRTTYPGFSREIRRLPGASLNRDYSLGDDRSQMIAAGLVVSTIDIGKTLSEVILSFGTPEYQQFAAGSGLAVGAVYGPKGLTRQILIFAEEPLLAHNDYAKPIGREATEMLLEELLPPSIRTGKPQRGMFVSGAFRSERESYGRLLLTRNYVNDDMVTASAVWL
jgi:hypothetical protein